MSLDVKALHWIAREYAELADSALRLPRVAVVCRVAGRTGPYEDLRAVPGFQSFAAIDDPPALFPYLAQHGPGWEYGVGSYQAGRVYRREIIRSSNNGAAVAWGRKVVIQLCVVLPSIRDYGRGLSLNEMDGVLRRLEGR
jgi:hypothetical protein